MWQIVRALTFLFLLHASAVHCEDERDDELRQVYKDDHAVLYFNRTINPSKTTWAFKLYSKAWKYTKKAYGPFISGREGARLTARFYTDRLQEDDHSYHAGVALKGPWVYLDVRPIDVREGKLYDKAGRTTQPNVWHFYSFNLNSISWLIEEINNGISGSPAKSIWGAYGFDPIMAYDILLNIGKEYKRDANEWKEHHCKPKSYAKPWMKDWWLPLYEKHGKTKFLSRFFKLIAQNWPTEEDVESNPSSLSDDNHGPRKYVGQMNLGEFVHFMSGAARKNTRSMAESFFDFNERDAENLRKAQEDYPSITY